MERARSMPSSGQFQNSVRRVGLTDYKESCFATKERTSKAQTALNTVIMIILHPSFSFSVCLVLEESLVYWGLTAQFSTTTALTRVYQYKHGCLKGFNVSSARKSGCFCTPVDGELTFEYLKWTNLLKVSYKRCYLWRKLFVKCSTIFLFYCMVLFKAKILPVAFIVYNIALVTVPIHYYIIIDHILCIV